MQKKTATQKRTPVNSRTKPDRLPAIFNELFPIGTTVAYRPSKGSDYEFFKVRGQAHMNHGEPVAFIGEHPFASIRPEFVDYDFRDPEPAAIDPDQAAKDEPAIPDDNAAAGDVQAEDVESTPRFEPSEPGKYRDGSERPRTAAEVIAAADPELFTQGEAAYLIESIDGPGAAAAYRRRTASDAAGDVLVDLKQAEKDIARRERAVARETDELRFRIDASPYGRRREPLPPELDVVVSTASIFCASGMFEPLSVAQLAVYIMAGREYGGFGPVESVCRMEFVDGNFVIKPHPDDLDAAKVAQGTENRSTVHDTQSAGHSENGDGPFLICKNCGSLASDHKRTGYCPTGGTIYEARTWGDGPFIGDLDGGVGVAITPTGDVRSDDVDQDPAAGQPVSIDDQAERVAGLDEPATPDPALKARNAANGDVDGGERTVQEKNADIFEHLTPAQTPAAAEMAAPLADFEPPADAIPPAEQPVPELPSAFEAIPVPDDRKASAWFKDPSELALPGPYPDNATTWRARIAVMCAHLGINPAEKLEKFDLCPTELTKREYLATVTEYYSKYYPDELVKARDRSLSG
jgi:hypothetical protein